MATSSALRKLAGRLGEVEALLALCSPPDLDLKEKTAAAARDSALLRGALVLLCSHVEGFFEDLIIDVLAAYELLAGTVGRIPVEIRARQVIGLPTPWDNSDPLKRWDLIQECVRHLLINGDAAITSAAIDAGLHIHGFANPGTAEIGSLFKTVGVMDVWDRFAKVEADRLVKDAVDAIVHRRNQIAHGSMESIVTRADVDIYVARTKRVAEIMDEIVANEIGSRVGKAQIWEIVEAQC